MNARGRPQRRQRFFCRVLYFGGRWDLTMLDTFATLQISLHDGFTRGEAPCLDVLAGQLLPAASFY